VVPESQARGKENRVERRSGRRRCVVQVLDDPIPEALAIQRCLDVGHGPAERIRDLSLELGERGAASDSPPRSLPI